MTSFGRCVRYITPSTTSGVVSQGPNTWFCIIHLISRFLALDASICRSGLYRWLMYVPEYVSQFCGSSAARRMRS